MALTNTVLTIQPTGAPSLTPAGTVVFGPGDVQEPAFVATYQFTGDAATTAVVVNWIDGVQTLPFTPKAVLAFGIPAILTGSQTQDATGVLRAEGSNASVRVTAISATSCTVNYSTAVAASPATAAILLVVYR